MRKFRRFVIVVVHFRSAPKVRIGVFRNGVCVAAYVHVDERFTRGVGSAICVKLASVRNKQDDFRAETLQTFRNSHRICKVDFRFVHAVVARGAERARVGTAVTGANRDGKPLKRLFKLAGEKGLLFEHHGHSSGFLIGLNIPAPKGMLRQNHNGDGSVAVVNGVHNIEQLGFAVDGAKFAEACVVEGQPQLFAVDFAAERRNACAGKMEQFVIFACFAADGGYAVLHITAACNWGAVRLFDVAAHGKTVPLVGFLNHIVGAARAQRGGEAAGGRRLRLDARKVAVCTDGKLCAVADGENFAIALVSFSFTVINERVRNLSEGCDLSGSEPFVGNDNLRLELCRNAVVCGCHLRKGHALSGNAGINRTAARSDAGDGHRFTLPRGKGCSGRDGRKARGFAAAAGRRAAVYGDGAACVALGERVCRAAFRRVNRHGKKPVCAGALDFDAVHVEFFVRVRSAENGVFVCFNGQCGGGWTGYGELMRDGKISVFVKHRAAEGIHKIACAAVGVAFQRRIIVNAKAGFVQNVDQILVVKLVCVAEKVASAYRSKHPRKVVYRVNRNIGAGAFQFVEVILIACYGIGRVKIFCKQHAKATRSVKLRAARGSGFIAERQEYTRFFAEGGEILRSGFARRKKHIFKIPCGERRGGIRMAKGKKPLAARSG